MERRCSMRAQVDLPAFAFIDGLRHACRAIDIAPRGMVIERTRSLAEREMPIATPFELHVPSFVGDGVDGVEGSPRPRPIRARGRLVWTRDRLVAVKFIDMRDHDRLTIAELLDDKRRAGVHLH